MTTKTWKQRLQIADFDTLEAAEAFIQEELRLGTVYADPPPCIYEPRDKYFIVMATINITDVTPTE